jgi:hypothetical protein
MVGSTRDHGRMRAEKWAALAALALGIAACGASPSSAGGWTPQVLLTPGPEAAGGAEIGPSTGPSAGGAAGGFNESGGFGGVVCVVPLVGSPVLGAQDFSYQTPAHSELFSWATDEQAAALRTNQVLFPSNATTDAVAGTLQSLAANGDAATVQVAKILSASLGSARVAWPEPWAIRIGPEGEDPGKNLLRIVLKPEAWVAIVEQGVLQVVDMQNQHVDPATAAAAPERFGAILHERDRYEGGPPCPGTPGVPGGSSVGFREFLVSNLGMVQEWSLGTDAIRARLQDNIDVLSKFFTRTRSCPDQSKLAFWNQQVVCSWDPTVESTGELAAYQQALAIPTSDYFDAPPQLAALIDKLQGDLFEPDPLVVTPGSP